MQDIQYGVRIYYPDRTVLHTFKSYAYGVLVWETIREMFNTLQPPVGVSLFDVQQKQLLGYRGYRGYDHGSVTGRWLLTWQGPEHGAWLYRVTVCGIERYVHAEYDDLTEFASSIAAKEYQGPRPRMFVYTIDPISSLEEYVGKGVRIRRTYQVCFADNHDESHEHKWIRQAGYRRKFTCSCGIVRYAQDTNEGT